MIEFPKADGTVYGDDYQAIAETWEFNDITQAALFYKLDFANKKSADEQVTAINFPDGGVMIGGTLVLDKIDRIC